VIDGIWNVRRLSVLRAVAQQGSISAAARAIHLSQPAVTQALAALERQFGEPLFARTSQGATPTGAGRLCAVRVARALQQIEDGLAAIGRQSRGATSAVHGISAAQLKALVAVVERGGFGSAARSLGMTRGSLHRAARQLERSVGVRLFETTSHGVRPSREAERLALHVQLASAELAQARAEVATLGGAERGRTVIGAMPLARSVIVPAAVLRFAVRRPRHAVSILDGPYESMLDALRRGLADILVGALREDLPQDVRQEYLFDDPLAIIARARHPLATARRGRIRAPTRDELRRYPWVAPRRGSPLRRRFDALFAGAGVPPSAPIECNSLVAARAILMGSDRLMLLSAHQVYHELAAGQLAQLPHPSGRITRAIGLTVRRNWVPTQAQRELIDALRDQVRELGLIQDPHPIVPPHRAPGRPATRGTSPG